ncbi:MAG: hypothetical protein ACUVQP_00160 [Bacteroidales bacterium]
MNKMQPIHRLLFDAFLSVFMAHENNIRLIEDATMDKIKKILKVEPFIERIIALLTDKSSEESLKEKQFEEIADDFYEHLVQTTADMGVSVSSMIGFLLNSFIVLETYILNEINKENDIPVVKKIAENLYSEVNLVYLKLMHDAFVRLELNNKFIINNPSIQ